MDLFRLIAAPLRRPARFLIPLLVAGLAAACLERLWPIRYQATAILRVERADPGVSIERTILDHERLRKLVEESDAASGITGAPPPERLYQLRENLAVHSRGPDTYAVEYVDDDPQRAADVVQRLTLLLTRERSVAAAAPPAADPLATQLAQAKRELEEKEASHGKTRRTEQELLVSSRELLVLQKRYLSLLNQKMSNRLATAVEPPSQSVSFVVDVPARRPEVPISLGGRRLSWVVLTLGVLIGWVFSLMGAPRPPAPPPTLLETDTLGSPSAPPPRLDRADTLSAPLPTAWTEAAPPQPQTIAEERPETLVIPAGPGSASAAPVDLLEPGSVFLRPRQPARTAEWESQPTPGITEVAGELEPGSVFLRAPQPAHTAESESQPTPGVPEVAGELESGSVFLRAPQPARAARASEPAAAVPEAPASSESETFASVEPGSVYWKKPPTTATQPVPILEPPQEGAEEEAGNAFEPAEVAPPPPPEPPTPEQSEPTVTIELEDILEPPQQATVTEPQAADPLEPEPAETIDIEGIVEPPQPPPVTVPDVVPPDSARMDQANVPGLVVSGGPAHGSVMVLTSAPVERLVGAAAYCHLRVDLPNVAPVHARVAWDGFGLSLMDAGSSTGTHVNGRRIAGRYPLRDGDHVSLGPPGSGDSLRLLVYLPPPSERASAITAEGHFEVRGRAASAHLPSPPGAKAPGATLDAASSSVPPPIEPETHPAWTATAPRRSGGWLAAAATIAILAVGAFVGRRLFERPAPVLAEVTPAKVRTGQTIFLDGSGFDRVPEKNTVRLGEQTAPVISAREDRLEIAVPRELPLALPAAVSVSVEVGGRRSGLGRLSIVAGPRLSTLEPPVARRGDLVTALGEHLAGEPVAVLVAGLGAEVVHAQPNSLQFRVPAGVSMQEGTRLPVDVWVAGEQAERAFLIVGRLPVVTELAPRRGSTGERVTLRGYGFDPDPTRNRVLFGDEEALVLSASATELIVSAPASGPLLARQAERAVTVQALGATSSRVSFTMLGPPSGMFVPHFYAAPVPELPVGNHAFVSTELGPVMLLTGPAGSSSPAERAAGIARVLNDLVEEAAKPLALTFEVEPVPSVALAGGQHVVATATPRDALGYEGLWAQLGKPGRATPHSVATHWTALLQDYLTLFVQHQRPTHVLAFSPRGQLLVDIYAEALKATGGSASGVPTQVLGRLWPGAAERLREMALLLPAPGQSNPGAVVVGRWQGTMQESEKGVQPIQLHLFFEGGRLAGSLTRKSPRGVAAETRLRDVSYDGGALAFALPAGGSLLQFRASVREDVMAGVIHAGPQAAQAALGSFTLSYVE